MQSDNNVDLSLTQGLKKIKTVRVISIVTLKFVDLIKFIHNFLKCEELQNSHDIIIINLD